MIGSGTDAERATRLAGSNDLYASSGRRPSASITFVTAQAGATGTDATSAETRVPAPATEAAPEPVAAE